MMLSLLMLTMLGQQFEFPFDLDQPTAYFQDYNADGVAEIFVRDGWDAFFLVDDKGRIHSLANDMHQLQVFPYFWEDTWFLAAILDRSIHIFREGDWEPVQDVGPFLPLTGTRSYRVGPYQIIPCREGHVVLQDMCFLAAIGHTPFLEARLGKLRVSYPKLHEASLNADNQFDFFATPQVRASGSTIQLTSFIGDASFWSPIVSQVRIGHGMQVQNWCLGYLDDDPFLELAVLASKKMGGSLFDELQLFLYRGEGQGKWSKLPLQTLETNQNIWQDGPMMLDRKGLRLFYYKGLIRSLFRLDFFQRMEGDLLDPEARTTGWKMEDADRDVIYTKKDFDGDGIQDLMLLDDRGLVMFSADQHGTFDEDRMKVGVTEESKRISVSMNGNAESRNIRNRVRGNGRIYLIAQAHQLQCWRLDRNLEGTWVLERLPLEFK